MGQLGALIRLGYDLGCPVRFIKTQPKLIGDARIWTDCITSLPTKIEVLFQRHPQSKIYAIINLAHELGHYWDWRKGYDYMEDKIDQEEIAWEGAKILLQEIGFTDWNMFDKVREEGLITYYKVYCYTDGEGNELEMKRLYQLFHRAVFA